MTSFSRNRFSAYRRSLQSQANRLSFAFRNFFSWQPPMFSEMVTSSAYSSLEAQSSARLKAQELETRYSLESLRQRASEPRFLENLAYLEWLEVLEQANPQAFQSLTQLSCLNWLDVGAKNWSYVDALDAFIRQRFSIPYRLDGLELDPHRRYANLSTRAQAAQTYTQPLPNAQYHPVNALDWRRKAHIISQFLPFVSADPHLAWGLPMDYFQPEVLLAHLLDLLEPGGLLLVINQGAWEAEAQQALWQQVASRTKLRIDELGSLPSTVMDYRYPRYGWLCQKL